MSDQHKTVMSINAVRQCLERGEYELPLLAAPDGTVAVKIEDLRALYNEYAACRDMLALGERRWIERWEGSGPDRGSSIWSTTPYGNHGDLIARFGDGEKIHDAVSTIVALHNAGVAP